jgi:hypothetical protein
VQVVFSHAAVGWQLKAAVADRSDIDWCTVECYSGPFACRHIAAPATQGRAWVLNLLQHSTIVETHAAALAVVWLTLSAGGKAANAACLQVAVHRQGAAQLVPALCIQLISCCLVLSCFMRCSSCQVQ